VLSALDGEHSGIPADASQDETAAMLAGAARDVHGRIDVLVNNAGIRWV
jgi:NAD(P)-dependent dehydrogenase (short-subunit alcohol dehydrogenase family)